MCHNFGVVETFILDNREVRAKKTFNGTRNRAGGRVPGIYLGEFSLYGYC
jgi:hypothetical protein